MEPLRNERCWKCHRKMNPLGEAFEVMTGAATGPITTLTRTVKSTCGRQPVRQEAQRRKTHDTQGRRIGEIAFSGDPQIDGKVKDAVETDAAPRPFGLGSSVLHPAFVPLFHGSQRDADDSKTLIEAEKAYVDNGGSFKALSLSPYLVPILFYTDDNHSL